MTTWQRCTRKLLQGLILLLNVFLQHASALLLLSPCPSVFPVHRHHKQLCVCISVLICDFILRRSASLITLIPLKILFLCDEGSLALSVHLTFLDQQWLCLQGFNTLWQFLPWASYFSRPRQKVLPIACVNTRNDIEMLLWPSRLQFEISRSALFLAGCSCQAQLNKISWYGASLHQLSVQLILFEFSWKVSYRVRLSSSLVSPFVLDFPYRNMEEQQAPRIDPHHQIKLNAHRI